MQEPVIVIRKAVYDPIAERYRDSKQHPWTS